VSLSDVGAEGIYFEVLMCGGREEVGLLDSIPIDRVVTLLHHIAGFMGSALEKANPSKASAELGVEFGLEEGKLVALIARGTAKANLKIKLEWDRSTRTTTS
jgi:hypothetical protein